MHRKIPFRNLAVLLLSIISVSVSAQWTNLNTGINDNLTGAVFLGQNGLVSGAGGLYYTINGGAGAASWTHFEITNNPAVAAIYANTSFTHCYSDRENTLSAGVVYACGRDNVSTKAVIFKVTIPSMAYELIYEGPLNSKLNKIDCYQGTYLAAGDDGLLVGFTNTTVNTIPTGLTDDLLSVGVFQYYALLGADQKMYMASYSNASLGTITEIETPDVENKDVALVSNNGAYSISDDTFTYAFATPSSQSLYSNQNFYAPLNANGLAYSAGRFYVATQQGVYKSSATAQFQNTTLEWQPSSLSFNLNDFWSQNGSTALYAFGNNGVVLSSTNTGGATRPYVDITSEGGCFPGSTNLRAITGSANSYSWYVNGELVQSGATNFNYTFPALGSYEVTLNVENSFGETGTDTKTIHLVSVPQINKPVTLSDNILCKEGTIEVQIADSEPNVYYILKTEGQPDSNFGQSMAGNGGLLSFTTTTIDVTGNYYIYAKSTLANCGDRFSGSLLITVEETKADFHSGLINAKVNEPVTFSQNAVDAQNFEWQFSNGGTPATSTSANPQVTFSVSGPVTASLHAWSDNDCHDIVTEQKPTIYEVPSGQSDCFLLVNNSNDPEWPGHYNPDISQMIPTSDGLLLCGTYFDEIFDSKFGIVKSMPGKKGGYLAKYDRDGVVRWVVYNENTQFGNHNDDVIHSTTTDSNGNIYLSGYGSGMFVDNTGHKTDLAATPGIPDHYLIKLNANGEMIWYMQNYTVAFVRIAVDKEDNLVVLTDFSGYNTNVPVYFNGVFTQTIGVQDLPNAEYNIVKFNPAGTVIWETKADINSANAQWFVDLGFDSLNNIYISAAFDGYATIYEPNGGSQTISGDGSYGSKIGLFKLDENGTIIWKLRSRTENSTGFPSDQTRVHSMVVEEDGTVYMTGQNSTGQNSLGMTNHIHHFENTDGSVVSTQNGEFFLARINPDGICQWIQAAGSTYYGWGSQILKSGNEIHVVGQVKNNGPEYCTATFDSSDGIGYDLTINRFDYFVAVYSDTGILKRIFLNNENVDGTNAAYFDEMPGFFKGEGDYFYLAKNLTSISSEQIFDDFGMTSQPINGTDGTVVRFTEGCGILKYNRVLGVDETANAFAQLQIVPNPTSGEFKIDLNEFHELVSVAIYDIAGKQIALQEFSNTDKVTMQVLGTSGVYFVRLKTADGEKMFKLLKY